MRRRYWFSSTGYESIGGTGLPWQGNCTEALVVARPDVVRSIHTCYFEVGADASRLILFAPRPITLAEFSLADQALEINQRAVAIACKAAGQFTDGRFHFVLGAIGSGAKFLVWARLTTTN